MQEDFSALIEFKQELEKLLSDQTKQLKKKVLRLRHQDDSITTLEQQVHNQTLETKRLFEQGTDWKRKCLTLEQKVKVTSQITIKDLKKKTAEKIREVELMKELVKSSNKQLSSKDFDIKRYKIKIDKLE